MKIVIDIPDEIYQDAIKWGYSHLYDEDVATAVANGTPLPKGLGTLVEGKEMLRKIYDLRHRASIFSNNDTMDVLDELIRFVDLMPVLVGGGQGRSRGMTDGNDIFGIMSYAQDEIVKFFREHAEDIEKLNDELFDAIIHDMARIIARRIINERRMHSTEKGHMPWL